VYDDTAAIGKLYRRQDEIGTPWCVTVDVESLDDGAAAIRDRDSMTQERIPLEGTTARRRSASATRQATRCALAIGGFEAVGCRPHRCGCWHP
jgi:glycyl-tRNA synthetase (class II)